MVSTVGTVYCNTLLVCILLKHIKFKLLLKIGKIRRNCVDQVHVHPVEWT